MNKTPFLRFLGLIVLLLLAGPVANAQLAKVSGKVMDGNDPVMLTQIQLRDGSTILQRSMTDAAGNYEFAKVEPGQYQIYIKSGEIERTMGIVLSPGETEYKNIAMAAEGEKVIIYGAKEIFTQDPIQFVTLTRKEIKQMPMTRTSTIDYFGSLPGITQPDHGQDINVRGQRPGGTVTFIDGQKVYGDNQVPQASINQVTLINGGVPAEFGDVTGGILLINTYNPGMKGWTGKPLTKEEKKAIRQAKKDKKKRSELANEGKLMASAE